MFSDWHTLLVRLIAIPKRSSEKDVQLWTRGTSGAASQPKEFVSEQALGNEPGMLVRYVSKGLSKGLLSSHEQALAVLRLNLAYAWIACAVTTS